MGSEQELSGAAPLSSFKEAAADLRLLFNSFSSLDMLVSCERQEWKWFESVLHIRWGLLQFNVKDNVLTSGKELIVWACSISLQ